MQGGRRRPTLLHGSARGVVLVVVLGAMVMLCGLAIAAVLTWMMV